MHSDIIINLQSKNMGIIFFQPGYSRKKVITATASYDLMFCKVSVSHTDSYSHTASAFNELHKIPI